MASQTYPPLAILDPDPPAPTRDAARRVTGVFPSLRYVCLPIDTSFRNDVGYLHYGPPGANSPELLLLHGAAFSAEDRRPLIPRICPSLSVTAIDLPVSADGPALRQAFRGLVV